MKTKVLFLIESLGGGGAEKVLYTLLKNIDRSRFDVTLCCVHESGVYLPELRQLFRVKPIVRSPRSNGSLARLLYKLKYQFVYKLLPMSWVYRLFVPHGSDVEVAFIEGFCTKLLSSSSNGKARRYAWVHTDLQGNHWIEDIYAEINAERASYERYDEVIGVSNVAENSVRQLYGLTRTRTLYNPIDADEIQRLSREPIEPELHRKDDSRLRLVSTGRFVDQKRFDRLLRIVDRLRSEQIDVELWLLGDGPLRGRCQRYVEEHGLQNNVRFLGFRRNPYPYMAACDLFVCSSSAEGYSTAMTEACILGLPMVTTDCSGMSEILDGGKYGVITENSCDALYDAVKAMVTDRHRLAHYRTMSQQRSGFFSLSALMRPIEQLLSGDAS